MIRKSGSRFSEKIVLEQKEEKIVLEQKENDLQSELLVELGQRVCRMRGEARRNLEPCTVLPQK